MKTMVTTNRIRFSKLSFAIIFLLFVVAGLFTYSKLSILRLTSAPSAATVISQSVLENKYGLRVNLIAVTAAGGMLDLRLKMLDGEKAKLLLQDKKNFPTLVAGENNITLSTDAETSSQEIKFENNGGLFLLFPNNGNVVKPGSTVIIAFGDIQLEPVVVK
jgi:hypothetical protein